MSSQHFPVVIEQDEDGYFIVSCPTFAGCHSYGKTMDEALKNIKEAIQLCIEDAASMNKNLFVGVRDLEVSMSV